MDEDKNWIRIYPIHFRSKPQDQQYKKFHWIEVDLIKTTGRDFRPESYRLADMNEVITISEQVKSWDVRKEYVLHKVYNSIRELLADSADPGNISLATYKPKKILSARYEATSRDWSDDEKEHFTQSSIFDISNNNPLKKLPYKFKYDFLDEDDLKHSMQVLDWEIGALYWNCFDKSGSERQACEQVVKKMNALSTDKDMYFILGTTLDHHHRRLYNPFTIVGLFYPPHDEQLTLF